MRMERERIYYENAQQNYAYAYSQFCNGTTAHKQQEQEEDENKMFASANDGDGDDDDPLLYKRKLFLFSPSSSATTTVPSSRRGFIEHPVSKLDTLAGVAIKYGVEVSDIKKMNGLVTDLQMFGLKSLHIPLPGRHPPSHCLSNDSDAPGLSNMEKSPSHHVHSDVTESFQSLRVNSSQQRVSAAMSSLQGYYGLQTANQRTAFDDGRYLRPLPTSHPPLSRHRKSRSLVDGFLDENNGAWTDSVSAAEAGEVNSEKWNEKLFRRRLKSEADFNSHSSEMLMRDDSNSGGAFSTITGKSIALRSKAASRTTSSADYETGAMASIPIGTNDTQVADGFSVVRKSSSTSSLHDSDTNSSSIWPASKWSLKPDLQALTASAITRPIFDGLPKPISGRKNKAALD
ncbi:hypothetical protein K2173_005808 [Erythroxylum novogranatense]|uniref:LysM domain-containing protein n=1 Tax=Erythroxylum novogranatense TaxID=1862640 RepID=A0AAV8U2Q8_9ROSI|nr:hypothetical protein K2173_005808 [Erythroxylum novogranatense]